MSNFHLYTLVTGTGGHSSSMIIIRYIMNQIFVFSRNLTGDKHGSRAPQHKATTQKLTRIFFLRHSVTLRTHFRTRYFGFCTCWLIREDEKLTQNRKIRTKQADSRWRFPPGVSCQVGEILGEILGRNQRSRDALVQGLALLGQGEPTLRKAVNTSKTKWRIPRKCRGILFHLSYIIVTL